MGVNLTILGGAADSAVGSTQCSGGHPRGPASRTVIRCQSQEPVWSLRKPTPCYAAGQGHLQRTRAGSPLPLRSINCSPAANAQAYISGQVYRQDKPDHSENADPQPAHPVHRLPSPKVDCGPAGSPEVWPIGHCRAARCGIASFPTPGNLPHLNSLELPGQWLCRLLPLEAEAEIAGQFARVIPDTAGRHRYPGHQQQYDNQRPFAS